MAKARRFQRQRWRSCSGKTASNPTAAVSPLRSTARWCAGRHGQRQNSRRATTSRSCACGRVDEGSIMKQHDSLVIVGRTFHSRLFLGTAGYPNRQVMLDAVAASGTEMATASIRRISLVGDEESLVDLLAGRVHFLPNTAGCQTAKDAVLTAELAREALQTNWVKLEVIGGRGL